MFGSAHDHESLTCTNIYISGPLYIAGMYVDNFFSEIICIEKLFVHINSPIYISKVTVDLQY